MLQKQNVNITFAQGLDTKTDPKQVQVGKFLSLQNSIFTKGGLLQKRNGYGSLVSLPNTSSTYLTVFNGDLTAIGTSIYAYSSSAQTWLNKGAIQPVQLSTMPLIRSNTNQSQADVAIASNGVICTVYTDQNTSSLSANQYKYVIADSLTGQNIVAPTVIATADATFGTPKIFLLANNFIILFTSKISTTYHLNYFAINTTTLVATAPVSISADYGPVSTVSFDAEILNNALYIAWNNAASSGGNICSLSSGLVLSSTNTTYVSGANVMSVTTDSVNNTVWITAGNSSNQGWTTVLTPSLNVIKNLTEVYRNSTNNIVNVTSSVQNGVCQIFFELDSSYSYVGLPSHHIDVVTCTITTLTFHSVFSSGANNITITSTAGLTNQAALIDLTTPGNLAANTLIQGHTGTTALNISPATAGNSAISPGDNLQSYAFTFTPALDVFNTIKRSVGLASKSFIIGGIIYVAVAYSSPYQPTYFLMNGTGSIIAKLAYQNGGGYLPTGLPKVTVSGTLLQFPYLFKDLIAAANKETNVSGVQTAGIYSQLGINLASINLSGPIVSSEIGNNLNISGGFLWSYDGYVPVEQNFFVYPDSILVTTATGAGSIAADTYYYQVTYEWTDNQGNAFRSAPSLPVSIPTTTASSTNTINVPYLRLTYKTANPVKIVVYRWAVAQQTYYQVTSITTPTLNSTTADSVAITDTFSNATILGNNILYTTGGVVEDVNPPATNITTLFDDRLWLVDAEDPNLLYFSKQVIEASPVEMSDLFTFYVAPTTGSQGSTGPITALSTMDDKLIIFKRDAAYYINGTGPDNTGSNNQYSQPIFITSTVGCANPASIVFIPAGLMFQSDKGIWLLGRDLSTNYIGAPVEAFNSATVQSAVNIPGTNQVRFTLSSGVTLMYDYYYQQWGTFVSVPAISSTLYQNLHTYLNKFGQVLQETPGVYLDGTNPVLMSFTTSWLNLAGLQGYQRSYFFYLLGDYITPHKLMCEIAYDYNPAPTQGTLISPTNFAPVFGGAESNGQNTVYGQDTPFGGPGSLEAWRVFLSTQRCTAFQLTVQEVYDSSFGVPAGQGLTLSGINLVYAIKKGWRTISSAHSVGGPQ